MEDAQPIPLRMRQEVIATFAYFVGGSELLPPRMSVASAPGVDPPLVLKIALDPLPGGELQSLFFVMAEADATDLAKKLAGGRSTVLRPAPAKIHVPGR